MNSSWENDSRDAPPERISAVLSGKWSRGARVQRARKETQPRIVVPDRCREKSSWSRKEGFRTFSDAPRWMILDTGATRSASEGISPGGSYECSADRAAARIRLGLNERGHVEGFSSFHPSLNEANPLRRFHKKRPARVFGTGRLAGLRHFRCMPGYCISAGPGALLPEILAETAIAATTARAETR